MLNKTVCQKNSQETITQKNIKCEHNPPRQVSMSLKSINQSINQRNRISI